MTHERRLNDHGGRVTCDECHREAVRDFAVGWVQVATMPGRYVDRSLASSFAVIDGTYCSGECVVLAIAKTRILAKGRP